MMNRTLADELVRTAAQQLSEGLKAKKSRMETIVEITDLYNNKTIEANSEVFNIPFSFLARQIELLLSKIDNPPQMDFLIPNRRTLSEKIKAAWVQEQSSSRAGWMRKDRAEKKLALLSGRGIAKVYASSVGNNYKSHYDVVDPFAFVADPTRGWIEDGNYHGETDIFKTSSVIKSMAKAGFYDSQNAALLLMREDTQAEGESEVVQNRFDRLKATGMDVQSTSFAGQKGVNLTEWIMRHNGTWFYLLFDPKSRIWLRADELSNVFANGKTPFVSWATHYDEYSFWSKSPGDDFYPIAEAARFLLNNAMENAKRQTRPMRLVDAGSLVDINELQDYIPDNVILRNPGRDPNLVTIETPQASVTLDIVQYLDNLMQSSSGVTDPSIQEADAKVGVFFGQLQQEADRIGIINKEYSESYAHKGYRFFWGLKEHLTEPKQVEMLGKSGVKLQQLESVELSDVDDVDDVIVSGGSKEAEQSQVEKEQKRQALESLTAAFPDRLSPDWVIKTRLEDAGYTDDEISLALDVESSINKELMEEADQAIQDVMLGRPLVLNMGADPLFMQRILDYVRDNLNYVKLDSKGKEKGIDKKKKEMSDKLLAHVQAHQQIVLENMARKVSKMQTQQGLEQLGAQQEAMGAQQAVDQGQAPTQRDQQQEAARPFEGGTDTASGSASTSQSLSNLMA